MNSYIKKLNKIFIYPILDSTNTFLKHNYNEFQDFSVIVAEIQTSGRGRLSRKWISNDKRNLYFSLLLKDSLYEVPAENFSLLTLLMAYSILLTLKEYNVNSVQIKWPNDILINSKKICGILSEVIKDENGNYILIIGVGLNFVLSEEDKSNIDKPATSILEETGIFIDKIEFLEKLILNFTNILKRFKLEGFKNIRNEIIEYLYSKDKIIKFQLVKGEIVEAKFKNITEEGYIIIEKDNKELTLTAGEIL